MDRLYTDRRMLKWLPFEALPEHNHYLKAVYDALEYTAKPDLCPDQIAYLNYRLQEAFHTQETITLTVFEKGRLWEKKGTLTQLDRTTHCLTLNGETYAFNALIDLQ